MALTQPATTAFDDPAVRILDSGKSLSKNLLTLQASAVNSKRMVVQGYDCAVYFSGTATSYTCAVYISPDGANFTLLATITEATALKRLDIGLAHSVQLDLSAVAGGGLTAVVYGESRQTR